jgi:hypothetical protein
LIKTSYCPALDDQQVGAAPDVAATYDRLPDSGWAGFRRGRSPKVTGVAAAPAVSLREAASTTNQQQLRFGRTYLLG